MQSTSKALLFPHGKSEYWKSAITVTCTIVLLQSNGELVSYSYFIINFTLGDGGDA